MLQRSLAATLIFQRDVGSDGGSKRAKTSQEVPMFSIVDVYILIHLVL